MKITFAFVEARLYPRAMETETFSKNQQKLIALGAAALIILGAYFLWSHRVVTTVIDLKDTGSTTGAPDLTIKTLAGTNVEPVELPKSAPASKTIGDDEMTALIQKATAFKNTGDYANAIKTLQFISYTWPQNPVSNNNLGDIYMNYLKDYPKAETAYLNQIKVVATDLNAYRTLFELY